MLPSPRCCGSTWEKRQKRPRCGLLGEAYLIPHVGLELKLERRTEDLVAHVHDGVLVAAGVQVVHRVLDDIQPLMARGLQVVLG